MGAVRSFVVLAFVAVGCAQAGERSIGDEYMRRLNAARCNCGGLDGFEECMGRSWFYGGGGLARAIDTGDVVVDEDAFERCLAETATCDLSFARPEACEAAFIGTHTAGEPCEVFEECASGLFCGFPRGAACGVCAPQRPLGASCGRWDACAPIPSLPGRIVRCVLGLGTLTGHCGEFAIEPTRAPLGAPCGHIDETETFSRLVFCEDDLSCSSEDRCVRFDPTEGMSCRVGSSDCGRDLICADNSICVRPTIVSERGAPCDDQRSPGPSPRVCDEQAGLLCIGGQCRPFPTREGEPCGYEGCGEGLHCDFTGATSFVGVCARPAPDGSYCYADGMCASRFCNQGSLRCTQPVCD
jgi:hypothetical protein